MGGTLVARPGRGSTTVVEAGRPELATLSSDIPAYVLATLSAATVGALLASRRPRHPVGWLLLGLGLPVALSGVATGYAYYGLMARPGALPAADWAALYHGVSILLALGALQFVLLLTPTGSLPSPRFLCGPGAAVGGGRAWPHDVPAFGLRSRDPQPVEPPLWPAAPPRHNLTWSVPRSASRGAVAAACGSAGPRVERQQLRWLALSRRWPRPCWRRRRCPVLGCCLDRNEFPLAWSRGRLG